MAVVISSLFITHAATYNKELYTQCERVAHEKKNSLLAKGLKDYTKRSEEIRRKAATKCTSISWYVDTSYRLNSKQILDARKKEYDELDATMKELRKGVNETYKAEEALCELNFLQKDTTTKTSSPK